MIKILKYDKANCTEIFDRGEQIRDISQVVAGIINSVKTEGDAALYRYCRQFDKAELDSLEVSKHEIEQAFSAVDSRFIKIIRQAAENIREFHEKQLREGFEISRKDGVIVGQKVVPIEKVGLYVPGGTAAYPSTVLMDSIPAKIAGCGQVFITTPPSADGSVNPVILAAAKIAGVDRIFKLGGAQAIAALAYGTETVPKVDKIVGPGNSYVAEAKRQVFGQVSIDMIAGPSEILIIADQSANPKHIAADLLSQAEHDKMASAVLITDDEALAERVSEELEIQIPLLPRAEIARTSIDSRGRIIITKDIDEAIKISNEMAPEHLELCVRFSFDYLQKIKNAGSIFMGRYSPEALGDYFAGPNHTLPTSGTARFSSPLSVDDFIKKTQYIYYTKAALDKVGEDVAYFARKEGLEAHARSITVRLEEEE